VNALTMLLSGLVFGAGLVLSGLNQPAKIIGFLDIFGRWDPVRAGLACLLFAAAETLQIQLQGSQAIPSQFVEMIPYLLTIIALAGVVGRAVPPAALGRTTAE